MIAQRRIASSRLPPAPSKALPALLLALTLGLGPLGCGTLLGFSIGSSIDSYRRLDLPEPYTESLPPLTGEVVRITTRDGRRVSGWLLASPNQPGARPRFRIFEEALIRADTLDVFVDSIVAAEVARGSHAYRNGGLVLGLAADAAFIALVRAGLEGYGGGP